MAYLALYRSWRPQNFKDVIGQEHITRTLKNALKDNRFSHAYLFSGPRGTGKTSTAKIFAKAVNCEEGISEEPCNQCNTCKGITNGSIMDVVEIDAASNRGVEEIRDLREKIKFSPSEAKYKVYIIDEVHMLTTEAFNALLKTLEEPPSHAIFILATTEPHKLPATIISRTQRFDFKRISSENMVSRLEGIANAEKVNVDHAALTMIARQSEGGMRDALSLLDQVISFSGERIETDDVLRLTGRASSQSFSIIAQEIISNNAVEALDAVSDLIREGKDPEKILEDLLYYYRDILLYKTAPSLEEMKDKAIIDQNLEGLSKKYSDSQLYLIIDILNKYLNDIKITSQTRIILELAIIKISKARNNIDQKQNDTIQVLEKRIKNMEIELEKLKTQAPTTNTTQSTEPVKKHIMINNNNKSNDYLVKLATHFVEEDLQKLQQVWSDIVQQVREKKVTVYAWLADGEPVGITEDTIVIAFNNQMHKDTTNKPVNKSLIEEVIFEKLGKSYAIVNILQKDWKELDVHKEKKEKQGEKRDNNDFVSKAKDLFGEDLIVIKN